LVGERRLYFKGSGGEGGPEEWAPRGGGVGKRERGGWARRGAVRWRGVSVAAAQPRRAQAARCHATMESGEVGATQTAWLTGGPRRDGGAGR
jgi:hypothetical protein